MSTVEEASTIAPIVEVPPFGPLGWLPADCDHSEIVATLRARLEAPEEELPEQERAEILFAVAQGEFLRGADLCALRAIDEAIRFADDGLWLRARLVLGEMLVELGCWPRALADLSWYQGRARGVTPVERQRASLGLWRAFLGVHDSHRAEQGRRAFRQLCGEDSDLTPQMAGELRIAEARSLRSDRDEFPPVVRELWQERLPAQYLRGVLAWCGYGNVPRDDLERAIDRARVLGYRREYERLSVYAVRHSCSTKREADDWWTESLGFGFAGRLRLQAELRRHCRPEWRMNMKPGNERWKLSADLEFVWDLIQ